MNTIENQYSFNFKIEEKHYIRHNYLTFCNDVLVSILKYADLKKLTKVKIEFKTPKDLTAFNEICDKNEDWQQWLIENGYKEELYQVYYMHTFFSLVSDFCNYMLESINCAAKMKVAVSYVLLRKPLKDTLGILEWMYINRDEFLDLLVNGDPKEIEITSKRAESNSVAIKELRGIDGYYRFRYNKKDKKSLEHIWNNANHLITTHNPISKTGKGNINFVFTNEKELKIFSDYYYVVVPFIMGYATELICEMFEKMSLVNDYTCLINSINRTLKASFINGIEGILDINQIIKGTNLPFVCPNCGHKTEFSKQELQKIQFSNFCCSKCDKDFNANKYMFDWEEIKINYIKSNTSVKE